MARFLFGAVLTSAFLVGCGQERMKIYDTRAPGGYAYVTVHQDLSGNWYYLYDGRKVFVDRSPGSDTDPRAPGKPTW